MRPRLAQHGRGRLIQRQQRVANLQTECCFIAIDPNATALRLCMSTNLAKYYAPRANVTRDNYLFAITEVGSSHKHPHPIPAMSGHLFSSMLNCARLTAVARECFCPQVRWVMDVCQTETYKFWSMVMNQEISSDQNRIEALVVSLNESYSSKLLDSYRALEL